MSTVASARSSAASTNNVAALAGALAPATYPMLKRRTLLAGLLGALAGGLPLTYAAPPALMLASVYQPGMPLAGYWVSEKYDGVRGYWDGSRLWTRGGEPVLAPKWFTAGFPAVPMDGELWAGRGRFEQAASAVRSQRADDRAWRAIRFMVFDLPAEPGDFDARLRALRQLLPTPALPWLLAAPQSPASTDADLQLQLQATLRAGGEGLMLHRGGALYRAERNDDLLKVKAYDDAEARVVGHLPGKGRHQGRMGALLVEMPDGRRFKLGGGFTDAQRDAPPPVGTLVTYRYNGTTRNGLPRFARFVRVRSDLPAN